MGIMEIMGLVCGLALFLYGMDVMGNGLKKSAGRKLKTILGNLTSSKLKGFLLGLGVTAVIQSSSATTVMVVGFVNAGTMLLSQAISVIMGANLGTAVTAWLTALNSLGNNEAIAATAWLEYLTPDFWMPILALIGIAFIMFAKKDKQKDIGSILLGFAVLMVGMSLMSDSVGVLKTDPNFAKILTIFDNPVIGVLVGTILTAIVQSSSASIGILQALSATGSITFGMAIPIVLGQNIGTCVTAMLSALGANKNGKRTAVVHLFFNIIGVVFWLSMYYLIGWILGSANIFDFLGFQGGIIDPFGIAMIHTVFKILAIALMWPFTKLLEKLACLIVRGDDKKGDEYTSMLDERLLDTPSVAIDSARKVAIHMSDVALGSMKKSLTLFDNYDAKLADEIRAEETQVDIYEDALGSYLVKISSRDMDEHDSAEVTKLLHLIGDFERISDHAVNIVESVEEKRDKNVSFSETATKELGVMVSALNEILDITKHSVDSNDLKIALSVEPLEQVIDYLRDEIKLHHTIRLQKNLCSIELGFILSDILTNLERVSDHCSNIAGCLVEMSKSETLDLHHYLHEFRDGEDNDYSSMYEKFMDKYALPSINE
ncbi:MAG: Na/Pi cotransporter family protein [Ruminococcaceae bacterium]|nr:Na/Pi cotransporter family protein [Oscillospiraceae bacterium]